MKRGMRRALRWGSVGALPLVFWGCVSDGDFQVLQREVQNLRRDVAAQAKTTEGSRVFLEERLGRIEAGIKERFGRQEELQRQRLERAVGETKEETRSYLQSQANLGTKMDELSADMRMLQGRIEENNRTFSEIGLRAEDLDQKLTRIGSRMDALERQVKDLQQARVLPPPAPVPPVPPATVGPTPPAPFPSPGTLPPPAPSGPAQPAPPVAGTRPSGSAAPPPPSPLPPPSPPPAAPAPAPVSPPPPVASTPPPPSPPPPAASPEEIYRTALNDYTRGNCQLSVSGFQSLVALYPKSSLIANAQYWLGESFYCMKNYGQAVKEFDVVVRDFPNDPKVPSALLKEGYAYQEMGDGGNGNRVLCDLIKRFPRTREARLARDRVGQSCP